MTPLRRGPSRLIELLSAAGELLSSSLDDTSTLRKLTELLVPRMADWCAVQLEKQSADDMHVAHVNPAKVATVRSISRDYPLTIHDRGFGRWLLVSRRRARREDVI